MNYQPVKINWLNLIIVSIPGVVWLMMLHNYVLYGMKPFETLGDIVKSIFEI